MAGLINLGSGLSAAGNAIAGTFSAAGVEAMKSDLEGQMLRLSNQLSTERETTLQQQQQTFQAGEAAKTRTFQAGQQQQEIASRERMPSLTASAQVAAASQEAANTEARIIQEGNNPDYILAQKKLAEADPTKIAQANELNANAFLAHQQGEEAQAVYNVRKQIIAEQGQAQPDQAKLDALNNQLSSLLTNPQAMAAMRTAAVGAARIAEDAAARGQTALDALTQKLTDPTVRANPDGFAELQTQQKQLQIRQNTLNDNADDARREMYSFFGIKANGAAANSGANVAAPKAPANPADRQPNTVYSLPNGQQGKWMGNGWQIVRPAEAATAQ